MKILTTILAVTSLSFSSSAAETPLIQLDESTEISSQYLDNEEYPGITLQKEDGLIEIKTDKHKRFNPLSSAKFMLHNIEHSSQMKKLKSFMSASKRQKRKVMKSIKRLVKQAKDSGIIEATGEVTLAALEGSTKAIKPTLKSASAGVSLGGAAGGSAGVIIGSIEPGLGNLISGGIGVAAGAVIGMVVAGSTTFALFVANDVAKTLKKSKKSKES